MATMTSVVLLVVFCATMTVIAIGRLLRADERDPVDSGTILVLIAITTFVGAWVGFEHPSVSTTAVVLLVGFAIVALGVGLSIVGYYWNNFTAATAVESDEASDNDDLECPKS